VTWLVVGAASLAFLVVAAVTVILAFGGPRPRTTTTGTTRANEGTANEVRPNERTKGGEAVTQDTSFRLGGLETVELKQGGTRAFEVSINRGAGFRSEVKFSLRSPTPREVKGITFTPADWMLSSNENGTTVTARAAPDAAVGTYSWHLIVRPRVGKEVTRTLTVVVRP
jgi:hypothetical protein